MTIERVAHTGAYVLSDLVGEGAREYLFTRTYYGYTLSEAKTQFKIALEGECDNCANSYDLSSRDNRCGDCGNCDTCCTHKGEGK